MRTKETTIYKFDELSDRAKEKAREWWRISQDGDNYFSESVIEDAAECGEIIGIDLRTRPVKLMGGGTRYEPCVYWSGFSSQGDGACFEGTYRYSKGSTKNIRQHAPQDQELHRIADELAAVQKKYQYRLIASTKQQGHYSHSGCMQVSVDDCKREDEETIEQLMRDFADWIYRRLEKEYEYVMSDEQVDESIQANEYEFTEEGGIA